MLSKLLSRQGVRDLFLGLGLLGATLATDIVTWVQAGVALSIFPMILLYLFCQKSFVESIASTGLVG